MTSCSRLHQPQLLLPVRRELLHPGERFASMNSSRNAGYSAALNRPSNLMVDCSLPLMFQPQDEPEKSVCYTSA